MTHAPNPADNGYIAPTMYRLQSYPQFDANEIVSALLNLYRSLTGDSADHRQIVPSVKVLDPVGIEFLLASVEERSVRR